MLRGYIRPSPKGPSVEEQRAALRSVGLIDDRVVYVEETPKRRKAKVMPEHLVMRHEAIRALKKRADDVLVVSSLDRLGLTTADILGAVEAVTRKGAFVLDASTGETYCWHPGVVPLVAAAARAERVLMLERTKKAREAGAKMGAKGGRPKALGNPKKLAEAKRLWPDPELSGRAIAKLLGVGLRTLYDHLGPRSESKAKPGRKPRSER